MDTSQLKILIKLHLSSFICAHYTTWLCVRDQITATHSPKGRWLKEVLQFEICTK